MRTLVAFCSGALVSATIWTYLDITMDDRPREAPTVGWPAAAPEPTTRGRSAPPLPRPVAPSRTPEFRMPGRARLEPLPPFAPMPADAAPATSTHAPPTAAAPTMEGGAPPSSAAWPEAAPRPSWRWVVAASTGVEAYRTPADGDAVAWGVAVQVEPRDYLSLELGYLGTSSSDHVSTSVETIGRLTPFRGDVRPYVFAGAGWRHFHERAPHNVGVFPHGVGVLLRRGRWRGEARVTLRPMSDQSHRSVSASTQLGLEF